MSAAGFARAPVTLVLLGLIVLMFGVEMVQGGSTNVDVLKLLGANHGESVAEGQVWRFVAAMFLHVGLFHLLVNCWALFQLGTLLEIFVGSASYTMVYFVSGISGSLASYLWTSVYQGDYDRLSAGASGAIFGILGALITFLLRRRDRLTPQARSLLVQLVVWAGINVVLGFTVPVIDNAGHLGGLAAGLLFGMWLRPRPVPPPRFDSPEPT